MLIVAQGTGIAPFLSILKKAIRSEGTVGKVAMVLGVRDNKEHMIEKEFLEGIFRERRGQGWSLTVACSREVVDIEGEIVSENVTYRRGYV